MATRGKKKYIFCSYLLLLTQLTMWNGSDLSSRPVASIYGSFKTCHFTFDFSWFRHFGSWLSNSDFRTRTNKEFKYFCSSLARVFEIHWRRLLTWATDSWGRSRRSPERCLFPYGNKGRGTLHQADSCAPQQASLLHMELQNNSIHCPPFAKVKVLIDKIEKEVLLSLKMS